MTNTVEDGHKIFKEAIQEANRNLDAEYEQTKLLFEQYPALKEYFEFFDRSATDIIHDKRERPTLFANTLHNIRETDKRLLIAKGVTVKVVMVSRFGDIGITNNLRADRGYLWRVFPRELHNYRSTR